MLKATKNIGKGLKRDQDKTWHPQLADKAAGIKTHVFYALKNCDASMCKANANYVPSRLFITDDKACELLEKCIKTLFIYKHLEKYLHCMDPIVGAKIEYTQLSVTVHVEPSAQ